MRICEIRTERCEHCGHGQSAVFYASQDWRATCKSCGKLFQGDHSAAGQRFYANTRFAGSEAVSMTEGFHPNEVGKARRMFEGTGATIRSDGAVEFSDRATQVRYMTRKHELMREGAERQRARMG